jgi:TolB-like protein/DNA-binding winged helix-turn-helix (wHTH) protein/Tfp pilus assembly protein PilF
VKKDFLLGKWLVCVSEGTMSCSGEKRRLEPKALSVLMVLAEAEGALVSRDKLLDAVWYNQVVGDDVINSNIAALRKALGDDRKTDRFIQTIPKKGYKLVKDVQWLKAEDEGGTSGTTAQTIKPPSSPFNWRLYLPLALILLSVVSVIVKQSQGEVILTGDDFSIAVLPFDIFSAEPDLAYFADGLAEEMLHQLVTNPNLKVMARSASFKYRNSGKSLSSIAEELKVKYLIEGSVRIHNDDLRVTVQLIDARNNFHLWSRVFDDSSGELFRIQQQVGVAVSDMLNITETTKQITSNREHPESEQAYKYFVMAQAHMKVGNYEESLTLYKQAIELSPAYALAYVGKAASYLLLYQYQHIDKQAAISAASLALEEALILDRDLAEAYATRGLMYTYLKQYDKAEQLYLKALELHPNLRLAHHNLAFMLWQQSRYKEAVKHAEIAQETDPLSAPTFFILGDSLASLAEFEKAIALYQHCQKVLPDSVACRAGLANLYQITGELDKARINLEMSASVAEPGDFWHNNTHASYLIHEGRFEPAASILNEMALKNPVEYFLLRTRWLAALAGDDMNEYINSVKQLAKQFPEDMDVQKFQAMVAYWTQDYELAINLYEKVLADSPRFMFNLWDYSDGMSHAVNLAASYDKTGRQKDKQQLLMQIEKHFNSFSDEFSTVPGGDYIRAQYDMLLGNTQSSEQLLKQLQQSWALNWLPQKDPFWHFYPLEASDKQHQAGG